VSAASAHSPRRPSAIAGYGLFAGSDHSPGDRLVTFDQDVLTADGFGSLNHSCDPNLGWSGDRTLVARRAIAAGEELTVDYSTSICDPSFVLYCHCGTTRCRQVVEGRDWQIPQLQTRYAGVWAPRLTERIARGPTAEQPPTRGG